MNVKDLLKKDQGIDVMISEGAGRRDDPYVVEKCVVAESALTQMKLIQGIERGMHEIWRITEWVPCNEGSATEVIRTESVHFTEDKIETTDRALYFDTSDVSGYPYTLHPLVCWRSPDDLIVLPFELGWVHFSGAENNAESSHDFDQTIFYGGLWCKATVYVYSRPPGDDVINMRDAELMKVTSAVAQTLPDLEDPWPGIEIGPFALKYFITGEDITVAGVAVCGRYFVKLRLTFKDDHKLREMMKETVQVLADSVETALGMIGMDKNTEELREIDVDRPEDRKSNGRLFISNGTSENFALLDYESHTFIVLLMYRVCLPLLWPWYCEDMNDPNARGAIFRTWGSDEPKGDEIANIIVADATDDPTEPDVSMITGADIAKIDNYLKSETAKGLAEQEMKLTKWMGSKQKQSGNINCLISRYTALDQGQSKCIISYRQTIKDRKIVALGCFNEDLKEILEVPILSALESVIPVNYDLGGDYAPNTNSHDSEWALANEFGDSKIYVDKTSIQKNGSVVVASVRYALNPPGTDKRNDKPIKEMLMLEEYDISNGKVRIHSILFTYTDETLSEPLSTVPTWSTATDGSLKTLQFLQNHAAKLADTNKSKWWKFWQ